LYAGQLAIKYQWTRRTAVAAGFFYTAGGETQVDNLSQGNAIETTRYQVSGFIALSPASLLTLQYGADLSTENGFQEARRFIMRLTTRF
jgi:hypothetical protein